MLHQQPMSIRWLVLPVGKARTRELGRCPAPKGGAAEGVGVTRQPPNNGLVQAYAQVSICLWMACRPWRLAGGCANRAAGLRRSGDGWRTPSDACRPGLLALKRG